MWTVGFAKIAYRVGAMISLLGDVVGRFCLWSITSQTQQGE